MEPKGLSTMSPALPDATNYHRWVLGLLKPYLKGRILEVGFGHGQYTRVMAQWAERIVAVDCSPDCLSGMSGISDRVDLRIADLERPGFASLVGEKAFDAVVCLNVLEHLRDDRGALGSLWQTLKPGGVLLLFVPAHPALFGQLDRLAGHYRRYDRRTLRIALIETGFRLLALKYFNPLGGLGWWLNSMLCRPRDLSSSSITRQVVWFDRYVQPLSHALDPLTRGFFGQSLWSVAARPHEAS